jgi:hypothetical protein
MTPTDSTQRLRQTCKWLALSTAMVFALSAIVALLLPQDFFDAVVRYELMHAALTVALLVWGWRGGDSTRLLGGLALAAGMVYIAPVMFMALAVFAFHDGWQAGLAKFGPALLYLTVLLTYYGVALALYRKANLAGRQVLSR